MATAQSSLAESDTAKAPEQQTPAQVEEKIQQCLRMLEGKSDEHKFAGLLMITKLAEVDAQRMRRMRRQVVEIVGVSFFLRLLSTRGGNADEELSTFQALGLNLIASFCEDPTVAELFTQEKLVRLVLDQLAVVTVPLSPSKQDCVSILQGLVQTDAGKIALSQDTIIHRIVSALKQIMQADKEATEDCASSVATIVAGYWSVLEALAHSPGFWAGFTSYEFEFLCLTFSQARGSVAIQILTVLNSFMQLVEQTTAPAELLSSRALSDLRVGVARFLRAKWTGHERDECLRLMYQLMHQSGIAWMLPGTTLRTQETQDEVSDGKFVLLVLKLVSVEIKLMLDEVELALIQMDEKTVEQVDEELRQEREVQRTMAVLPICYGIVEFVIAGLVSSADDALVLPHDILLQLKLAFADAVAVVLEHLTAARDFMKTHHFNDLVAAQSPTVYQLDAIVFASVRVISAWLAEDSDTCVEQVLDVLPFLVCYKPLAASPSVTNAAAAAGDSVSSVIFPPANNQHNSEMDSDDQEDDDEDVDSDDEMDAVSELLKSATKIHANDAQIDQLHFLLPGLLQISATPEGAQVIAEEVDVLKRVLHFCCTQCATISRGDDDVGGGVPTLTLSLGILMNLLLLRSSNVQVTFSGQAASTLPNEVEWYRALSFLLPVACASGSHVMAETPPLTEIERGEDDRYVMVLHIVCVILLIGSNFQQKKTRPCTLSPVVVKLVAPFNHVVAWMMAHPPDEAAESASDLLELCRGLAMRSPLTVDTLQ